MKKHISLLLTVLCAFSAIGQNKVSYAWARPTDTAFTPGSWRLDSVMRATYYRTTDTNKVLGVDAQGYFILRTKSDAAMVDSNLYTTVTRLSDSTEVLRLLIGTGGIDTSSLSNRIDARVKYTDTLSMLSPYLRKADTSSLSSRINLKLNISDTAAMLSPYLRSILGVKYADTATMLNPYLRKTDTSSLSARVDARVKYTDTSTMLSTYLRSILGVKYTDTASMLVPYLRKTDTSSLSSRINLKLNISDTASMLSPYTLGASSSTNDVIAAFDGTSGKRIKNTEIKRNRLINSLNIGLVKGGALSINADPTKFDISDGNGVIINEWVNPDTPLIYDVSWTGLSAIPVTFIASSTFTHVLLDSAGGVIQQTTYPTNEQFRKYIYLGQLGHTNLTTVSTAVSAPQPFVGLSSQFRDFEDVVGFIRYGNVISPNGVNLKLNKSSGTLNASGINFHSNPYSPNSKTYGAQTAFTFRYRTQTGNGVSTSDISPGFYDSAGTITSLTGTKYTNQRVFLTIAGNIVIQYGQNQYNSMSEALNGLRTSSFVLYPNLVGNSALIGLLTIRSTATDLSDPAQCSFSQLSKFGETTVSGVSSGGGTVTSVATDNGTGITGGTITTTGTLSIDTTLISTRAWRQKGVDSLSGLIALKANIASPTFTGTVTIPTGANITTPNILGLTSGTTNDSLVVADPSTGALKRISSSRISSGGSGISGLTTNYVSKATSATTIGNSQIFDNGTSVGVGTASPLAASKLQVSTSTGFSTDGGDLRIDNSSADAASITLNSTGGLGQRYSIFSAAGAFGATGSFGVYDHTAAVRLLKGNASHDIGTFYVRGNAAGASSITIESAAAGGTAWSILSNATSSGRAGELNFFNGSYRMTLNASGQLSVGSSAPISNAQLDVQSTTKAVYPSRMTTAQRDAMTGVQAGAIIYNIDAGKHQGYNGSTWNDFY